MLDGDDDPQSGSFSPRSQIVIVRKMVMVIYQYSDDDDDCDIDGDGDGDGDPGSLPEAGWGQR